MRRFVLVCVIIVVFANINQAFRVSSVRQTRIGSVCDLSMKKDAQDTESFSFPKFKIAPYVAILASMQMGVNPDVALASTQQYATTTIKVADADTILDADVAPVANPALETLEKKGSLLVPATPVKSSDGKVILPKDLKFMSDDSKMLTTTIRQSSIFDAPKMALPLDGVTPKVVSGSLPPAMKSFFNEPKYWGSLLVFVLIFDIMQNSAAVQKRNREFTAQFLEQEEKVKEAEAKLGTVVALQEDAISQSKVIDDLKAELAAAKMRAEFGDSATAKANALETEVGKKAKEIQALKDKLAKGNAPSPSVQRMDASATATRTVTPTAPLGIPKDVVAREKKLVDSLKQFMITEGYMAEGVANMMMAASAPEMLQKVSSGGGKQLDGLQKQLDALKAENKKLSGSQGDVKELKAQLASSEKLLKELQTQTQSKMDNAKSMLVENASDLEAANARIEKLTAALEIAMSKLKAAEKSAKMGGASAPPVAAPKKATTPKKVALSKKAPPASVVSSGNTTLDSKAMTPTQIKKMTKGAIEGKLKELGVSAGKAMKKDELITLLINSL